MRLPTSILCIALFAGPIEAAESNAAALAHWQEINEQVTDAFQRGDYARGLPLAREVHAYAERALGPEHPDTLGSLNNLAALYRAQGRYGEAEPLLQKALQLREKVLGPEHPGTLASLDNLASLYYRQGRYGKAEPLYRRALQLCEKVLGPEHADTLRSLNNLAGLYQDQGRYGESEHLYRKALQLKEKVLGPEHPNTLLTELNLVGLRINQDRTAEALAELQRMEPRLLRRAAALWYTTEEARVRGGLLFSLSNFQDVVLNVALQRPSAEAAGVAAEVVLRWKQPQAEEEAHLAALVRHSQDPRVRKLAVELAGLRARLPVLYRTGKPTTDTVKALEQKELALAQLSRPFATELRVQSAGLARVRSALLPGQALLELRQFLAAADFKAGRPGEAHIAGVLIRPAGAPVVGDLGPVSEALAQWRALEAAGRESADRAAVALYRSLFGPFEEALHGVERLYLAPDGALHLIPYERLKLADGRYWIERNDLRILQTGRDLTREPLPSRSDTLLALGGVDFAQEMSTSGEATAADAELRSATFRTREALGAFEPLEASGDEVERIADLYRLTRRAPAIVWTLGEAREGRLKSLAEAPRVLHLATHGFYLDPGEGSHNPLLDSGLALSGANQGLLGKTDPQGEDGVLYSLEALGLNLQGTELVALSACDTGRGAVDYSEGVYGLVRSLRVAGATSVLMTLYPVNDGQARDFMIAFYKRWLAERQSDPAAALRETKLAYLRDDSDPKLRDPKVWAPTCSSGAS